MPVDGGGAAATAAASFALPSGTGAMPYAIVSGKTRDWVTDEITGCILSALLSVVRPDLPAQLGPVGLEACRAHLHALRALGFGAASLGTDAIAPTQVEIAAFRQRFGALDAA